MSLLQQLANKQGSSRAAEELRAILVAAGAKNDEIDIQIDPESGDAVFEGLRFMYDTCLRMVGVCPTCTTDQPSAMIRSVTQIAGLQRQFRPARHQCIDID